MNDKLKITNIPTSPWIYQFFNEKWEIIYIGKSINLKSRVSSYFNWKSKLNFAKQKMVEQIKDIKTIITNNENESLILETTLIKKHLPKYNILMKDGKNHIYIKITSDIIPKVIKTRIKKGSGEYFWPYTSTSYVNNIIKITKKLFWHRSCNIVFEEKDEITHPLAPYPSYEGKGENEKQIIIKSSWWTKIPCIDYHIGRCAAPCLLETEKISEYREKINQIKLFLKWDNKQIIKKLEEEMKQKASSLEFEEANKIKLSLESIHSLEANQIVREWVEWDFDVVHILEKFDKYFIGLIEIRESKIVWFYNYEIINKLEEDKEVILSNFIDRRFAENAESKSVFILPLPMGEGWGEGLIKIEIPKIWVKKELLSLCYKNIYEYATKAHLDSLSTKWFTKKTMQNLLKILWYKAVNKNIVFECNDVSHISWNHTVASRSIIENGKSNPSKYRKFKIKTLESGKIDDFGSMKEITQRRIKEIQKSEYIPDLIIIDWGKGQLSSVMKALTPTLSLEGEGANLLSNIQIVSIAKREEELFLPWESESIILEKDSNELRLIQKIRDEAHRFAITFNRDSRIKSMKKNILESIPGIWPKTRKAILKEFGSVDNLKNIPREELKKTLSKSVIENLENHGIV